MTEIGMDADSADAWCLALSTELVMFGLEETYRPTVRPLLDESHAICLVAPDGAIEHVCFEARMTDDLQKTLWRLWKQGEPQKEGAA